MNQEYFIKATNIEGICEVYLTNDNEPWFIGSKIDCEEWIHNRGQLNIYYE